MKKDDKRDDEFDELTAELLSCLTDLKNNFDTDGREEIKLADNILNELNKETAQDFNSEGSVIRNFAFKKYLMDNVEAFDNYKDFVNRILSIRGYKTTTIVLSKEDREKKFENRLKNNFKKEAKLYDSEDKAEDFLEKIMENNFDSIRQEENIVEKYNEAAMFIQYEISGNYELAAVDRLIELLGNIRKLIVDSSEKLPDVFVPALNDAVKDCSTPEELKEKLDKNEFFKKYYECVKKDKILYIRRKKQEVVDDNENVKPVPRLRVIKNKSSYKIEIVEIEDELYKTEKINLQECPRDMYPDCINSQDAVRIIQAVYRFSFDASQSNENMLIWNGTKISDAQIMYSKERGWIYKRNGKEVNEFSVYVYNKQPLTSTGVGKAFMNGHHGIPSEWAFVFWHCGGFYNPDEAPVLMLRDTLKGSTHRFITTLQVLWKKHKSLMLDENCTYSQIREVAREQLCLAAEEYALLDEKNSTYAYEENDDKSLLSVCIRGFDEKVSLELSKEENTKIKEQILGSIEDYFEEADKYFEGIYNQIKDVYEKDSDEMKKFDKIFKDAFKNKKSDDENK